VWSEGFDFGKQPRKCRRKNLAVGDAMMHERGVLSLHQTSISHTIHHNDRALLLKEDGLMLDDEEEAEEALAALADLASSGGGNQDGGEVEDGEEEEEDDMLIPEDLLQEDDNEGQKDEEGEEEQEEYTGPVVVEYEHDVAMPSLMTGEQFEAAMEAQFLQPHRVSTQARKALTRKRTRKGVDANADNDALVLFALLRPHPTRWYGVGFVVVSWVTLRLFVSPSSLFLSILAGGAWRPRRPISS